MVGQQHAQAIRIVCYRQRATLYTPRLATGLGLRRVWGLGDLGLNNLMIEPSQNRTSQFTTRVLADNALKQRVSGLLYDALGCRTLRVTHRQDDIKGVGHIFVLHQLPSQLNRSGLALSIDGLRHDFVSLDGGDQVNRGGGHQVSQDGLRFTHFLPAVFTDELGLIDDFKHTTRASPFVREAVDHQDLVLLSDSEANGLNVRRRMIVGQAATVKAEFVSVQMGRAIGTDHCDLAALGEGPGHL